MPGKSGEIVISYCAADVAFAKSFKDSLVKGKLDVYCLGPSASAHSGPSERGQAVLNCKVFVLVLSEQSASDQQMKDELALAYISNKFIFPVARASYRVVSATMDSGIKLMLAKINWTFFIKPEQFASSMENLITRICAEIAHFSTASGETDGEGFDVTEALNSHVGEMTLRKRSSETMEDGDCDEEATEDGEAVLDAQICCDFWERHFGNKDSVTWVAFKDAFASDYGERITKSYGEEKERWFVQLLYKDVFVLNKTVQRSVYQKFAGNNVRAFPHHFYERVRNYAIGCLAMREVFHMESYVRLAAIQNLGSFQTSAVIDHLFDLIEDSDANSRAVAALALAKTGKKTKKIADRLIRLLEDEDRLVRESACLCLAHIKCTRAVPHIVNVWRNDAIKHVREAADLALNRIGGDEARQAIKMTAVLTDEITRLRTMNKST